jgi:sporulation protein YlmC with PRC-barrel domain
MSDRFAAATGRKVVSRASAENLGALGHIVVDIKQHQVAWLVVGKGRKALVVAWDDVSGFGPDAVMVADESALHPPRDDREHAGAEGKLELVGKRVLSDKGDDLGTVSDIVFDPRTGSLETLVLGEREEPASALAGAGSFAVIVRVPAERAPDS